MLSASLLFELDRDTEGQQAFRGKVARLIAALHGPLQQSVGIQTALVVFVAADGGTRRLDLLQSWTQVELERARAQRLAVLFRLAAFNPTRADPEGMFTAPIWRVPFSDLRQSLLPRLWKVSHSRDLTSDAPEQKRSIDCQ